MPFKVLCIDTRPHPNSKNKLIHLIEEGKVYTVFSIVKVFDIYNNKMDGYWLEEFMLIQLSNKTAFDVNRFVRISDIDELELIKQREETFEPTQ